MMRNLGGHAWSLVVGVSLLAVASAPALAQPANVAPAAVAGAQSAGGVAVGTNQAGDIIVTAQRRSERLRDVPISITALNTDTLTKAGVTSTLDLARVSTSV